MTATSAELAAETPDRASPQGFVEVVLVEMPECHLCEQAKTTLHDLSQEFPLRVSIFDAGSLEGRGLIARHRPTMAPLVLIDGGFFSSGRLPRNKLVSRLRAHVASSGETR